MGEQSPPLHFVHKFKKSTPLDPKLAPGPWGMILLDLQINLTYKEAPGMALIHK